MSRTQPAECAGSPLLPSAAKRHQSHHVALALLETHRRAGGNGELHSVGSDALEHQRTVKRRYQ